MSEPAVSVFVKLEYWDVYRTVVVITARQLKRFLTIFGVMAVLTVTLLVFAVLRPSPEKDWYQTGRNSLPLAWVFAIPVLLVFVAPLWGAQKALADPRLAKGIRYEFTDAGIHVETSVAKADLQWGAFLDAIETGTAFLLLPTRNVAHTLPLRFFGSRAEIEAMRQLLRRNIPKAKLRR